MLTAGDCNSIFRWTVSVARSPCKGAFDSKIFATAIVLDLVCSTSRRRVNIGRTLDGFSFLLAPVRPHSNASWVAQACKHVDKKQRSRWDSLSVWTETTV